MDQIPKAIRTPDKSVKTLIESRVSLNNLDEVLDTLGKFDIPKTTLLWLELN